VTAIRIGLTGPIGCGKSTVAGWLAEAGAVVIDADEVARDVVEPGSLELDAIATAFGPELRMADGRLDRAALGRIVFRDPEALARLERIVHPAVRQRIREAIERADADRAPAIVVEAIKLVEGGLALLCDEVWLVRCEPETQRSRLRGRGVDDVDAEARIATQGDLESRLRGAVTRVIDTSGSTEATRELVRAAWEHARAAPGGAARDPDRGGTPEG
jgi:dephospho-CoA kinase